MSDADLRVEADPAQHDVETLSEGLAEHALPFTHTRGFRPLAVFARDARGTLVGGVYGHVNWNWLQVSLFWVSAEQRRHGLGSRLLGAIEQEAIARGCTQSHLDTFSYQARSFYERLGYQVFAALEDYPSGHTRYFLRKTLQAAPGGSA